MPKTNLDGISPTKSTLLCKYQLSFKTILPLIFMLVGYITDVIYVAINGRNLINSDASAEMMLGRLLNTTGGVITDKWHYSSEKPDGRFFIITTPDEYTQNAET